MPHRDTNRSHESLLHTHTQTAMGTVPPPPDNAHNGVVDEPTRRKSKSSPAKKRLSSSSASVKDPFYHAASCPGGTSPAMYFEAKYYGACPNVPTTTDAPAEINLVQLLQEKKLQGVQIRCNLYFGEKGIAVLTKDKTSHPVVCWKTVDVASCATIKHPSKKGRRIGMLKVRDPSTKAMVWHLFKFCCGKRDNMSDCFRYVVDCSLREIGRAVTQRAQQDLQMQQQQQRMSMAGMGGQVAAAWDEPTQEAPPMYSYEVAQPTSRRLDFTHLTGEARAEAEDIVRSAARCSADEFVYGPRKTSTGARAARATRDDDQYIDVAPLQNYIGDRQ